MTTNKTISHPQMVAALVKPGADILATLTPEKVNMLHAAVGIAGEAGELLERMIIVQRRTEIGWRAEDRENVLEELGDLEFYTEQLWQAVRPKSTVTRITPANLASTMTVEDVVVHATEILDTVKKHVVYNQDLDRNKIIGLISQLDHAMAGVRRRFCFARIDVLQGNIDKLSTRYEKLQYTDEAAAARADKAEA